MCEVIVQKLGVGVGFAGAVGCGAYAGGFYDGKDARNTREDSTEGSGHD